ncbi:hypothetical protein S40288_05004 [Stachybotrys chartarum IBT 40288]|nr:hypothetical protein S40288_05004 [Stachybotrys chartarum IBT 40288]
MDSHAFPCQRRLNHADITTATSHNAPSPGSSEVPESLKSAEPSESPEQSAPSRKLPLMCSGCGAFTQTTNPHQHGYFDEDSKRVKNWLRPKRIETDPEALEEDKFVSEVLQSMDAAKLKELGLSASTMMAAEGVEVHNEAARLLEKQPVCDRCHNLTYHNLAGETAKIPMHHPTVESLRETIEESPHKYNHIYHVIDAADFPMSLIPRLNVLIGDVALRTRNRRSRSDKYQHDRKTEMSFIVTRSDLLGPTKEMVDGMMPWLREVLRDALGRLGGRVRLGSLKCVSAKRAWWTKDLKEDIWRRGGAGWMVGKVNVGKSQLFEAVFPKGRIGDGVTDKRASVAVFPREDAGTESISKPDSDEPGWDDTDLGNLLPPPQPATDYPNMPLVSALPGTTASPIRVPFGNGKGELIDLPGLARSDLDLFVKEEHRHSLIMKKRLVPEQVSVKPGQSLVLGGGLIRITPRTPDLVFLMYNFTPIDEHVTLTEKAIGFQNQTRESIGLENITLPGVGEKMQLAGSFHLRYDVTKERAGPLTRKNAIGLKVDRLPFRVLALDILIEGVGYVEIVAQVRARDLERVAASSRDDPVEEETPKVEVDSFESKFDIRRDAFERPRSVPKAKPAPPPRRVQQEEPNLAALPIVDVFTPEGRFIGSRRPLNGWLNNKPRVLAVHKRKRPRKSMKGKKKQAKLERRRAEGAVGGA